MTAGAARRHATVTVGGIAVGVHTSDEAFVQVLETRYAGFIGTSASADYEFDIELTPPADTSPDDDVRVFRDGRQWMLERGDFRAQWDPVARRGRIRQSANP